MIERYSRKVMRDVWTEENKFRAYLEVEILSCEAWSELGVIPREDVEKIRAAATFDVELSTGSAANLGLGDALGAAYGIYEGWGFALEDSTLKFKQLA